MPPHSLFAMPPGFTGSPLDRLDNERDHPDIYAQRRADPRALLLRLDDLEPVTDEAGALAWAPLAEAPADADLALLGTIDDLPRFVALTRDHGPGDHAARWRMLDGLPAGEAATYAAARSLVDWHARHGFCPNCGTPTTPFRGGWARRCPQCKAEHFPRTDPVVIMLAEHEGRVLVGRQARFPAGRYSALAGFVEVGESMEEAVARELSEEAGVRVLSVRYLVSQPWPFPSSLMLACVAPVESDALTLDRHELEDAFWVTRAEVRAALAGAEDARFLPATPQAIAHTLLSLWAAAE
ncbi:MAG TPA: NAD(+) diphosphatase [Sphingomonadaceae bacterium]|nr:NAD(+) diphosphatase [Sphingomonadaceae bacterium]